MTVYKYGMKGEVTPELLMKLGIQPDLTGARMYRSGVRNTIIAMDSPHQEMHTADIDAGMLGEHRG